MTNQRLQKLEMIIKSHFTLTITKSQRSWLYLLLENLSLVMHQQIIHWILQEHWISMGKKRSSMISFGNPSTMTTVWPSISTKTWMKPCPRTMRKPCLEWSKGLTGKIILKRHHLSHLHFNWRECKDSMKVNTVNWSQQPSPISYQPIQIKMAIPGQQF